MPEDRKRHPGGSLSLVMGSAARVGTRGWKRWQAHAITVLLAIAAVVLALVLLQLRVGNGFVFLVFLALGLVAPKRGFSIAVTAALAAAAFIVAVANAPPPQPEDCPGCIHHESGLVVLAVWILGQMAVVGTAIGAGLGFLVSRLKRTSVRGVAEDMAPGEGQD